MMTTPAAILLVSVAASATLACACAPASRRGAPTTVIQLPPIVIAHRGASGYRPEHTLAAYELAIEQGADYIEPDLVITKDGVLVARHEPRLDETTDVAERFPERRNVKHLGTERVAGWFVEDFTLAELRTLRARERLASRSHAYDGQFGIPTFDEVLQLVERKHRETGRVIGVYPETKSPSYFRRIGLPLEERLVAALRRHELDRGDAPVFIQSFEVGNLQRLRRLTRVRLVQLLDARGGPADVPGATYATMATPAGLRAIARYAHGVGLNKRLVIPAAADGTLLPPTTVVADAHAAGLVVHVWTFRSDALFLAREYRGDPGAEYRHFLALRVDGVFSDFPDHAVAAVRGSRTESR